MIDARIDVFDLANVSVRGTAAIYYGANPGLVLDARLRSGVTFGAAGFFDVAVDLSLHIDSRAGSRRFEIGLDTAHVQLPKVLDTRGGLRNAGFLLDPDADEQYTITSVGPGTHHGEKVRVPACGATEFFDDVDSVTGDFGGGNDQLILGTSLGTFRPVTVNIAGGDGDDLLINQPGARATLSGGTGNDLLLRKGTADLLDGGADDDELAGGAGATLLGGGGDDPLVWHTDLGRPAVLDGGGGVDRLLVDGTNAPETYALDGSAAGLTVAVGGPTPATLTAAGVETVKLTGAGGGDVVTVSAAGLAAAGVTAVDADLSRNPGKQPGSAAPARTP